MPWGDGTGPWGEGPMTGRGLGYCAGYPYPGYMSPYPRGGRWWSRGYGYGRGYGYWGRELWWRFLYWLPFFRPRYHYRMPYYYPPWMW